ncbi:MAG: TetR/AcrR family transcriptional regulator [Prevotellaceae bacterium]|jgi:AcrR family transcriptional regulator|nr:TetR/AcrR family transcriptional regulator [Prevotellaceae bacterium]
MANTNDIKVKILTASLRLFSENGIVRTSIDDVCHDLRISKKTFYACFATKELLLEELMGFYCQKIGVKQEKTMCGKNAIESMLAMVKQTYKVAESQNNNILRDDFEKYYSKLHDKFKKQMLTMFKHGFERNLQQGIEEGFYRSELDVEMLSAFQGFYAGSRSKKEFETFLSTKFSQKRILDFFNDIFIRIVVNEKGMKYMQENYFSKK